jgi:hypothetical protein
MTSIATAQAVACGSQNPTALGRLSRTKAGPRNLWDVAVELDHVFICVNRGAPEAERLVRFGLCEGASNVHPGQGTANRRFFFRNAMLELLWVENPLDAQSEQTGPTQLWERWSGRQTGACPFGIIVRPANNETIPVPFPAQEYRPIWLAPDLRIYLAPAGWKSRFGSLCRFCDDSTMSNGLWYIRTALARLPG